MAHSHGLFDKKIKIPNSLNVAQGHVRLLTIVALLVLLLKCFGVCPKHPSREDVPVDLVWILTSTSLLDLPFTAVHSVSFLVLDSCS